MVLVSDVKDWSLELSCLTFSEVSVLSVPLDVLLLESSTSNEGNENLDCVGVQGDGVHECSLSRCLSMIPVR